MIDNILYTEGVTSTPSYKVAFSIYVALGGDPTMVFESVEDIYTAINIQFGKGNDRITVESLNLNISENGTYVYDEDITGYKPVELNIEIPQKYTDEQVIEIENNARNEGYTNGYEIGNQDGFASGQTVGYESGFKDGNDEGYTDGYAEGLDDGAEEQKALLEDITITENGVYEKEDGYKKVTVEMAAAPSGNGFDFSVIGYDKTLEKECNAQLESSLLYAKTLYDVWDPINTSAKSLYKNDIQMVYAPNIDTSNVTNMSEMFYGCSKLVTVPKLNTSNVFIMDKLFQNCGSLTSIPLLDTSSVTLMTGMFQGCSSLTSIPQLDTSKVTGMSYMFQNCGSLTTIPLLDTSNAAHMGSMFYYCSNLTTIPQLDTSKVTDMSFMFYYCSNLTTIPQLDTSKVTSVSFMFYSTPEITNLGGLFNLGMQSFLNGADTEYFIANCTKLTHESLMNIINGLYDRASAGLSVLTLKLHANHHALLTDEEKAIATNKGWTLS